MVENSHIPPNLSATYSLLLLLLMGIALPSISASSAMVHQSKPAEIHRARLPVGKAFRILADTVEDEVEGIELIHEGNSPTWLSLNDTNKKQPSLFGIPQWTQVGEHHFGLSRLFMERLV